MNVKNINPFEQHVEKIVLAVAAAGALYLGYLAFQPVVVPSDTGDAVPVAQVEDQVTNAVAALQAKRAELANADTHINVPNFVQQYNRVANQRPLAQQLVDAAMPAFAPLQAPVTGATNTNLNLAVVTPTAPPPTDAAATYHDEQVVLPGAGQPGQPGQPTGAANTKDQSWVEVSGNVPIGDLTKQFTDAALTNLQHVPRDRQRAVVVAIEVQRRVQDGPNWGPWEKVQPSPASNPVIPPQDWSKLSDNDVLQTVNTLENQKQQVLSPQYYQQATATGASNPAQGAAVDHSSAPAAAAWVPPVDNTVDTGPIVAPTPAPAPAAGAAGAAGAAAAKASLPFHFFDDSVQPGHLYQYQVRVVYYNPLYRFDGGLKDPAAKDLPVLASAWVDALGKQPNGAVNVEGDLYFYVDAPLGGSGTNPDPKAGITVYKRSNGSWYRTAWNLEAGQPLAGSMPIVDKKTVVDISTPYTVVDVVPNNRQTQEKVIFRDDKGNLLEKDSQSDRADAQRQSLDSKLAKPPAPPPTTKPAPHIIRSTPQFPSTPGGGGGGPGFVPPVDNNL